MHQATSLLMSVSAAALTLGFSLQPHPARFWETNIVIAAEESSPQGNLQIQKDSSAAKSAKKGTQTGGLNQGTLPENDAQKIEQPARQNPTTGQH